MSLVTISDYLTMARTLLQDTVDSPYRYSSIDLIMNLNTSFGEIRRLRPDLLQQYFSTQLPAFKTDGTDNGKTVDFDEMYRLGIVYFMCGMAQLRDEENTQDARATVFLNKFIAIMTDARS